MKQFYETAKKIGRRALVGALITGSLGISNPELSRGETSPRELEKTIVNIDPLIKNYNSKVYERTKKWEPEIPSFAKKKILVECFEKIQFKKCSSKEEDYTKFLHGKQKFGKYFEFWDSTKTWDPEYCQEYTPRRLFDYEYLGNISLDETGLEKGLRIAKGNFKACGKFIDEEFPAFFVHDGYAHANMYIDSTLWNTYIKNGELFLPNTIGGISILTEAKEEALLNVGELERIATVNLGNVGELYLSPEINFDGRENLIKDFNQMAIITAYERAITEAKNNGADYIKVNRMKTTSPYTTGINLILNAVILSRGKSYFDKSRWNRWATATLYRHIPKEGKK